MTQKLYLLFVLFIIGQSLFAQQKLPVIKATSKIVDIRDGADFQKATWTINPDLKPDIYQTRNKEITFFTDLDSISFKVKPNQKFNFIILLNGKDSAYTQIVCLSSFLNLLKRASRYNLDDKREIPNFTYQTSGHTSLVVLRKNFSLDSIAGLGNETSRVLNLLHWVHNTVSHDGQHDSGILNINADAILKAAKTKHTGVSCGELATTLNDCYLSMGWASRKIYCFPKDSLGNDHDSHVINVVYLSSKKKWIWVDPTNDAYVMDEKGEPLSIKEVRERLIANKPLIINPDANWNHKSSVTQDYYLDIYMAKNLYRFTCPLNSEYGCETRGRDKKIVYINLWPLDYPKKEPFKTEDYHPDLKTTFINYYIYNPDIFWQTPRND